MALENGLVLLHVLLHVMELLLDLLAQLSISLQQKQETLSHVPNHNSFD